MILQNYVWQAPNFFSVKEIDDLENKSSEQSVQKEVVIDSKDHLPENNIEEISENENLCPICMTECDKGASICLVCGYSFK